MAGSYGAITAKEQLLPLGVVHHHHSEPDHGLLVVPPIEDRTLSGNRIADDSDGSSDHQGSDMVFGGNIHHPFFGAHGRVQDGPDEARRRAGRESRPTSGNAHQEFPREDPIGDSSQLPQELARRRKRCRRLAPHMGSDCAQIQISTLEVQDISKMCR